MEKMKKMEEMEEMENTEGVKDMNAYGLIHSKDDLSRNPDIDLSPAMKRQLKRERRMKTLRVSPTTVILVPEEKCNDEYREWYRVNRMGFRPSGREKLFNQDERTQI